MTQYKPDIVIYHKDCNDGFGAAFACWTRWVYSVDYIAAQYNTPPPDVTDKHVLIVDFSYKKPILEEMGKVAKSIIILDHHESAQENLEDYLVNNSASVCLRADQIEFFQDNPILAYFDMKKSGCRLAWEFCHGENKVPDLLNFIEDRDLWKFENKDTEAFHTYLKTFPMDFEVWGDISESLEAESMNRETILAEARITQKFFNQRVESITSFGALRNVAGYLVPCVNCPLDFKSEVGHLLLQKFPDAPFAATYFDTHTERLWSLRSDEDHMNVKDVAVKFGGGGHRDAAGFKTDLPKDIFS